jgi:S-adenosylmethionine:tRNA ribosyltransferase-isomerase
VLFFDYELPPHLVAQEPPATRDASRLLAIDRTTGAISHRHFRDLPTLLKPGDLLVLNDTKVLPARLLGVRESSGGKWEGLFLQSTSDGTWELLTHTRGYAKEGEWFRVGDGPLRLELVGRSHDRHWYMRPSLPGTPEEILGQHGRMPLPPYIRKGIDAEADRERYQTVYAENFGSVAAPTAGLHFTPELLNTLEAVGIRIARVTLHVGLGTFAPVKDADPTKHTIHSEWCEVSEATVQAIRDCREHAGRVIAVGTTSARSLESAARSGELQRYRGDTNLFIHPPYRFKAIDGLITNFHLPRTTLLLLVQSLAGSETLRQAYEEAIRHEYRFFSYGDAMLVL